MRNDRFVGRFSPWHTAFLAAVPALALLLTGCPADDPLPVGSVDGGAGSGGQGLGGGGSGGANGTGGASGTGGTTQPGKMCGGIAGIRCADAGEYCVMKRGDCAMPDAAGTCAMKAQACGAVYDPVCGCDGKTYGNECTAATAGVSVRATGPCSGTSDAGPGNDGSSTDGRPPGKICGGFAGLPCAAGEYCQLPVAHRRLSEFRGDAKVTTWLFQITRRVVLGQRRRERWRRWLRGSAEDVGGHLATPELGPVEVFERREAARRLYEVLDRMNEKYRMVLVLTKMEGLDADQIARVSGVSSVTVRVWLHRARTQFQRLALEGGAR